MADGANRPAITPDLKLGELLDAYPELEDVLIEIAPAFKKLRNPVLRRTVAKLTSLRQAAQVGGVSLGMIIGKLRSAAGFEEQWVDEESVSDDTGGCPQWVEDGELIKTFDAVEKVEAGGHPLPEVMSALGELDPGQMYAIITPFVPAPMIDRAKETGYQAWTEQLEEERFRTFFMRQ